MSIEQMTDQSNRPTDQDIESTAQGIKEKLTAFQKETDSEKRSLSEDVGKEMYKIVVNDLECWAAGKRGEGTPYVGWEQSDFVKLLDLLGEDTSGLADERANSLEEQKQKTKEAVMAFLVKGDKEFALRYLKENKSEVTEFCMLVQDEFKDQPTAVAVHLGLLIEELINNQ